MNLRRLAVAAVACIGGAAMATGEGLTKPVKLPAYEASRPACSAPVGLQKKLVFVQDNKREFMQGARRGLEAAARARGLAYGVAFANNDPARMIEQVGGIAADKTGAIVVAPINPQALAPALKKVIAGGAYVGAIVPPPATTLLNAPQYLTGKVLAEAAAEYIRTRLGGKAKVVLLTHDGLQFLAPRFTAMRDTLRAMPGVTIVADISPATVDKEGGYRTMKTILLAQPNIDVGQHVADWLEGKSIPQAMDILPKALTSSNIAGYERDTADPGAVYADPARRASYLRMYGNICFDTRENYINFPWSSETR